MKDRHPVITVLTSASQTHNLALALVAAVYAWVALHNRYGVDRCNAVGTVLELIYGANAVGSIGNAWANRTGSTNGNGNGNGGPGKPAGEGPASGGPAALGAPAGGPL